MGAGDKPSDLVQGTLHMLILKTLALAPMHGYGIGVRLEQISKGVFRVNAGSLFPALRRLERDGLIEGEWRVTENNRRAKYYSLSPRAARPSSARRVTGKCRPRPSPGSWPRHGESSDVTRPARSSPGSMRCSGTRASSRSLTPSSASSSTPLSTQKCEPASIGPPPPARCASRWARSTR